MARISGGSEPSFTRITSLGASSILDLLKMDAAFQRTGERKERISLHRCLFHFMFPPT